MSCQHLFLRGAKKGQACARHLIEGEIDYCNHHKNMVHHTVTKCQGRKIIEGRYVPCEEMTMSINSRCKQHKLHKVHVKLQESDKSNFASLQQLEAPEIIEVIKEPEIIKIIEVKAPEIIEQLKEPEIIKIIEVKEPEIIKIIEVKAPEETKPANGAKSATADSRRVFIEKPKRAYVKKTERKLTACDMAMLG